MPSSAGLSEGVRTEAIMHRPDNRGWFLEVRRIGRALAEHCPLAIMQASKRPTGGLLPNPCLPEPPRPDSRVCG
jgi:hypothetical protein